MDQCSGCHRDRAETQQEILILFVMPVSTIVSSSQGVVPVKRERRGCGTTRPVGLVPVCCPWSMDRDFQVVDGVPVVSDWVVGHVPHVGSGGSEISPAVVSQATGVKCTPSVETVFTWCSIGRYFLKHPDTGLVVAFVERRLADAVAFVRCR